jgi:hypothetical protein
MGLALLMAMSPAFADGLSYNYIELGYQNAELDDDFGGTSVDGDGYGIRGSYEVGESWFIAASYGTLDFDFGVDLDQLAIGGGYHTALSDRTDVFAALSYISAEVSASGFNSLDEDGYGVVVGLRGLVSDKVELRGTIAYSDLGDGVDGTAFGAGALYSFTDNFALGLEIEIDEDVTLYGVGARFYFGN